MNNARSIDYLFDRRKPDAKSNAAMPAKIVVSSGVAGIVKVGAELKDTSFAPSKSSPGYTLVGPTSDSLEAVRSGHGDGSSASSQCLPFCQPTRLSPWCCDCCFGLPWCSAASLSWHECTATGWGCRLPVNSRRNVVAGAGLPVQTPGSKAG